VKARTLVAAAMVCAACTAVVGPDLSGSAIALFDQVWSDFDLHYSLFAAKQIDWNAARAVYRPLVLGINADDPFGDANGQLSSFISSMLGTLRDDHVLFRGSRVASGRGGIRNDPVNTTPFVQYVGSFSDGLSFGSVSSTIGYINIGTFDGTGWVAEIDSALKVLDSAQAMIIDVRNNDGGFLDNAIGVAGRFAQTTTTAAYVRYRNGPNHSDFTAPIAQVVSPSGTRKFTGKVYVLTGRNTVSAAELFVMAMKALGQTTVVGDTTAGETGGPFARELQNGWSYQFPESIEFGLDGQEFEGIGLGPDLVIHNSFGPTGLVVDAQLAKAIALATATVTEQRNRGFSRNRNLQLSRNKKSN
jgi:carboxyl-terminal processing protease